MNGSKQLVGDTEARVSLESKFRSLYSRDIQIVWYTYLTMRYENDFAYWLIGLIDASGTFSITPASCRFRLSFSSDELEVLNEIRSQMNIGGVYPVPVYGTTNPRHSWEVQSKRDCLVLADFLAQFPLRTTKQVPCLIWRRAVAFWNSNEGSREERRTALTYLSRLIH